MLNEKTIGRHSKYSRYTSMNPLTTLPPYNYSYDPRYFPERDPNILRLITLNCYRFPHSIWSESILACLLFAALPDVLFIQEMKAMPLLGSVVSLVNNSQLQGNFGYFNDKEFKSGLNLATVYSLDTLTAFTKSELLPDFDIDSLYSLRRPFQLSCYLSGILLEFVNLHGISRGQRDHRAIRLACLSEFDEYLKGPGVDDQMIIGGDFNIDSDSHLLYENFENFNIFISKYENTSDHFLISKNLVSEDNIELVDQYQLNIQEYLQLSEEDYHIYMSDHFPVVLDIPKDLLS